MLNNCTNLTHSSDMDKDTLRKVTKHKKTTHKIAKRSALSQQVTTKIVSEYDEEIAQSQTADKPVASRGRATQQSRDTRKTNKLSKASSSQMIAKLEWTQSNAQQNIEQLWNPTMVVAISNEPTATRLQGTGKTA